MGYLQNEQSYDDPGRASGRLSMDAEDDVSSVVTEAVSTGKTRVLFLGLIAAQDAPGTRVSIDERYAPTFRWERHGGIC